MKIRPMGAELFHTERRADMTKLIVFFRNFANVPKINNSLRRKQQSHTQKKKIIFLSPYRKAVFMSAQ